MLRREFLAAALAAQAPRLPRRRDYALVGPKLPRPALCLFSKHLPKLDYEQLGKQVKELGFDGRSEERRVGKECRL